MARSHPTLFISTCYSSRHIISVHCASNVARPWKPGVGRICLPVLNEEVELPRLSAYRPFLPFRRLENAG